ncbi:flavincontaining amine [Micractinium conductrix]|uniref:Flavincontaining amine n=1 Tax=Micractinium conductrix TaxID=554055 RepID=A0A2P6UZ38_9CHLO|nr:flavincontaining amine [Micractinium conductrix]|eukprot:PSC67108.1 flavincontaining amine [Micractinium conductrix]
MGALQNRPQPSRPGKQRVCIVGGGVAGMACAWSLSRFPDRFDVEVWEELAQAGGVASSCAIDGGEEINDQVQGGAPSYRNNLLFFKEFGFEPHEVQLRIAFGSGGSAWTNHSDSALVRRLAPEIARFGRVLRWVHRLEPLFIFVPINALLRLCGFSADFRNEMVFPLTALFFGTGNQTPNVSAAVISRVFLDPQLRLFQYSPTRLLDSVPTMFAFPKLSEVFGTIASRIPATVRTGMRVERVERDSSGVAVAAADGSVCRFDQLVFACGAEEARRMLGADASRLESRLLGNVRYFNDLIVTHEDEGYMRSHYELRLEQGDMYFVRTDPADREKIEMSFNLTCYQPHLQGRRNIYQSIFLDDSQRRSWTVDAIDKAKVLKTRMTRQFAHTWRHFATWVPFVSLLQGRRRTWFAGAYTLFNTHEIATMSGLAVADRLGAPYPFPHDKLAAQQFDTYLRIAHGPFARRAKQPAAAAAAKAHVTLESSGAAATAADAKTD